MKPVLINASIRGFLDPREDHRKNAKTMITYIGDPIKVGVVFDEEKNITPKWFIWNGTRYQVVRVPFTWRVQEGRNLLCHFAVTDGACLYELCYDTGQVSWQLMARSPL